MPREGRAKRLNARELKPAEATDGGSGKSKRKGFKVRELEEVEYRDRRGRLKIRMEPVKERAPVSTSSRPEGRQSRSPRKESWVPNQSPGPVGQADIEDGAPLPKGRQRTRKVQIQLVLHPRFTINAFAE